jgi:hypothetical protein
MTASKAAVWPGPRLIVPMACDVLLIGQPDHQSVGVWAGTQTSYQNLYQGSDPGPTPFFNQPRKPAVGAHLMWTLPNTLRHGVQDATTGEVSFPLAPNRWLVIRIAYGADGAVPTLSAGVLNSDALDTFVDGTSQYPDPAGPPKSIGQYRSLDTWDAPLGPETPFLQAVGPGVVSWAAAYDNIRNVFSLHDDLPSRAATFAYMLTGWYADPASDPTYDLPSDADHWQAALDQLDWTIGDAPHDVAVATKAWSDFAAAWGIASGTPADSLPTQLKQAATAWLSWRSANGIATSDSDLPHQTLCHSLVATVDWKGNDIAYGTGAPGGGTEYPTVAIGNTAAEAISAYMAKTVVDTYQKPAEDIPVIERAMEAFQLGYLNQMATDIVGTEALIHQSRFGAIAGGSEWIVVQAPGAAQATRVDEQKPAFADTQQIRLTPAQTQALIALNAAQDALDALVAQLETQQGELGAVIFKANQMGRTSPAWLQPVVSNALEVLTRTVTQAVAKVATQQGEVATQRSALASDLGADYEVKAVSRQPYNQPADPVVLVAGAKLDTKLAAPGTYSGDDLLRLRVTGQSVGGLAIRFAISGQATTATLDRADIFYGDSGGDSGVVLPVAKDGGTLSGLPKEIGDLLVEAILLDPSAAPFLAARWFAQVEHRPTAAESTQLIAQIVATQRRLWSTQAGVDETITQAATGFQGVVPAAAGVSLRSGQPWTPVFVDWQVTWMPIAKATAPLSDQLVDWTLGEIDYDWSGTLDPKLGPQSFVGRSVVGAEGALALQAQFATFKDDPDYRNLPDYIREDLQYVADTIGSIDMLTTSLTGLAGQMTTRLQTMTQLIAGGSRVPVDQRQIDLVGTGPWTFQPATGTAPDNPPVAGGATDDLPFFPLRAGHLVVNKLWVIDAFGQVLVGQDPRRQPNPIEVVVAQSLVTAGSGNEYTAQLPPRLHQAARAELRLISACADDIPANSSVLTNPICGWVMSNHLDDSLMVFDTDGNNQGAIISIQRDTSGKQPSSGLRWDAVPGSSAALGSPPALANDHLQAFVSTLIARGMTGDSSFGDLLDTIDTALWRVGASGTTSDSGNLSVLVGRPLALVRARIEFELRGEPLYNESWAATGRYYVGEAKGQPVYDPQATPIESVKLKFRIGDLGYLDNGVVGYFVGDDYNRLYSAHQYTPTSAMRAALKTPPIARSADAIQLNDDAVPSSDYVSANHLIEMAANAAPVYLTILMDPMHAIPFISGSLPAQQVALAPGPTAAAIQRMAVTFRVGPVLVDPASIRMPLPAEIRGKWGWAARTDVTAWATTDTVARQDASVALSNRPPRLSEGWLTLTGSVQDDD